MATYSDYQYEIYERGLATGARPAFPVDPASLEAAAKEVMAPEAYAYVAGSASLGRTAAANLAAFARVKLFSRVLKAPMPRSHEVTIAGTTMPAPMLLEPVGAQTLTHPDGELASAKAAAKLGLTFVHSMNSTTSMEDVAAAVGTASRWFQLYIAKDRDLVRSFVRRAEHNGYSAVVVTLDTTTRAWRPLDLNLGHLPFIAGVGIANYLCDPVFLAELAVSPEQDMPAAVQHWRAIAADPLSDWDTIAWLRTQTKLPIILKGILHPDDAKRAVESGVDGIVVSNHGGRQLDGAVAALDVLPAIAAACPQDFPILFDSGIRSGSDIVKALALGAKAVLLARPWVWGLALGGEEGVEHVLRCFLADYDVAMGLTGHKTPAELSSADIYTA